MDRAYSTLVLKAVSDTGGKRTFTGIASTIATDRMDDVVLPKGAKYKLPFPFLWQHDSGQPIGWIRSVRTTDKQVEVDGEIHAETEPGKLKDRLDEAWQSIKAGLVRGLSIGFNPLKSARIEGTYGYEIQEWDWLELSAVTIPANAQCSITQIKSADTAQRAALGRMQSKSSPGASGKPANRGTIMKTLQELREERETKSARQRELVALFETKDHKATAEETAEFDALEAEISELDQDIRIKGFHARQVQGAKSVGGGDGDEGSRSRGGFSFKKEDPAPKFKGEAFTRLHIAKALAMWNGVSPVAVAEHRWGKSHPGLVQNIKATVAGGGTGSGEWGAELAQIDTAFAGDFVEYLYSQTVFDRLALRSVPARVRVKGQDGAFTGYWVGESKAIPMSKGDYSQVDLDPLKVAALSVISMELMEDSSPSAEMLVRDGLAEASIQRIDTTFLSANAASSGVSPAGILNGVTAIQASGADAAAVRTDMQALLYPFVTNKMASGITLLMNPATAMAIGWMVNALGQPEFPGLSQNGGTLNQLPVMVGDNVPAGTIIAIRSQDVWKIGDSGIRISMSREATIEQRDDPTGATDTPTGVTTTGLTNMFQEESVAFKVVRRINYGKRRSTAVAFVENAEYGGVVS